MNRRKAIALMGSSLGAVTLGGLYGRHAFLPPAASDPLDGVRDLAVRLHDSLSPEAARTACVPYDHPYRQYHNRGVKGGGLAITASNFSREQRGLLTDLLHAGLSPDGRERVPKQFFINWPGVHLMNVLFCGDPRTDACQVILTGPHLNLRLGGKNREGVAFGGPQVYGDQRGNYRQGLPGNVYRYQFEAAHRLFESLEPRHRREAVLERSPIQTQIELQGREGEFPGVPLHRTSRASRALAGEVVDGILSTYRREDHAYARLCLEENGGIDELHVSFMSEGNVDGSGRHQIFRLEGPAAVFYFRGYPHVHAFLNVGMDGDAPLSVGEVVGRNPAPLEGRAVKSLFEGAMKAQAGTDFGYYSEDAVVGRLRAGVIRTGDVYNLESWQDVVSTVEIRGESIGGRLLDQLRESSGTPRPGRTYSVATARYTAVHEARTHLGSPVARLDGPPVRDAVIDRLRRVWQPA